MFKYAKDPAVGPIAGWPPHKSINDSLIIISHFLDHHPYCYAICLKDSPIPIGCVELKTNSNLTDNELEYELGYWLGKPYWNMGIMTEASKALIDFGFNNLRLNAIWCGYYEGNLRSKRVQEKLGFKFVSKKDNTYLELLDEFRIAYANRITKEEWKNH